MRGVARIGLALFALVGLNADGDADIDSCGEILNIRCPDSCTHDPDFTGCACNLGTGECSIVEATICFIGYWDYDENPNTTLIGVSEEPALCKKVNECRSYNYGVNCGPTDACVKITTYTASSYYFTNLGPCPE